MTESARIERMNERAEMGPDFQYSPSRRVWKCSRCDCLNAWNWDDLERLTERTGMKSRHDAAPFTTKNVIGISHGSCFDNVCGVCGANHVHRDSPILSECYTH